MATMESSASPQPSTRHRVEEEFVNLLEEDFGIDAYSLTKAYMGVPPAPKTQAIALCEWAIAAARGDVEEAGKALRWWARKNLFLTRFLANSHLPLREEACTLEQRPSCREGVFSETGLPVLVGYRLLLRLGPALLGKG